MKRSQFKNNQIITFFQGYQYILFFCDDSPLQIAKSIQKHFETHTKQNYALAYAHNIS